ncbi:MAG: DUF2795 domain-containing protein [Leptolyngbyaceae bacterium]|nr:DUF2795 domain-containing protein [Leptolyngbyaceae bacterium]
MAVSAIDISRNLSGIDLPASKQELVSYARSQDANQEVIEMLQRMPDREYNNMADVEKGFGEVK